MAQVLVRNLDDSVIETYKLKAKLANTSLEQFLRDLLESQATLTTAERVAFSASILAQNKSPSRPLTKDEIREGLE